MNVYDLAHNLSRGLRKSEEYKKYQEALEKIKGHKEKEELLVDLRKKQMEIQTLQMMGQEVPEEKKKELEKAGEILNFHPAIKDFFEAEYHLGVILTDIQKIIAESVDLWHPDI